jgi:hypothetical protein
MSDTKISELSELTDPDGDDVIAIVDDPGGTPETKKITRDNFMPDNVGFLAHLSSDQLNIADAAWTKIEFDDDNTDGYDDGNVFNTTTNTFTVPTGSNGLYHFGGVIQSKSGTISANKIFGLMLLKNGTDNIAKDIKNTASSGSETRAAHIALKLEAGDTVIVQTYHNEGTATPDIDSEPEKSYFYGYLVKKD